MNFIASSHEKGGIVHTSPRQEFGLGCPSFENSGSEFKEKVLAFQQAFTDGRHQSSVRRYFNACTCIELEEGYETCALHGRVDQRLIKRKCKYFGTLATAALVEVQREPTAVA